MVRETSNKATTRGIPKTGARSDQAPNRLAGKFTKGQSGNPNGRPKGLEDKRVALRLLLVPHTEKLIKKAVSLALNGDTTALRICIDRLIPPIRAKDTPVSIGKLEGGLADQGRVVLDAVSSGRITPDEAGGLMQVISAQARIVEVDEIEKRVAALEQAHKKGVGAHG